MLEAADAIRPRETTPGATGAGRRAPSLRRLLVFFILIALGVVSAAAQPGSEGPGAVPETTGVAAPAYDGDGRVLIVPVADAIGPVTAKFIVEGIEAAEETHARAVVIELDTPGGLDASMRTIVKAILAARVPVAVYVAPPGARAASAGLFITLAAPVAAMASGTNIGAASPVGLGGGAAGDTTMVKKVTQDAMAYVRSLAERHGRNAEWAEEAVREGVSLSADEAAKLNVIDLVVNSVPELLEAIDGWRVETATGEVTLRTVGADLERLQMGWRERLLALITNPSIAYLLFLAGILGIGLELYNPGTILPGVVGGIALILAFYALQQLPVNVAGVLLILLSVVLFLLEVKVPSYGILSIGGVASLVLGSLFLYRAGSMISVDLSVMIPAVVTVSGLFLLAIFLGVKAQTRKKQGGGEGMVSHVGEAFTDLDPEGKVFIWGEYWNARATESVLRGSRVRVKAVQGLVLTVEPVREG